MTPDTDTLALLAAYRPSVEQLEQDWPTARRAMIRADIQAISRQPSISISPLGRPRSLRKRWAAAGGLIGAAAATLLIVQVVLPSDSPGGSSSAAAATLERLAIAVQSAPSDLVKPGQYRYLVDKRTAGSTQQSWTSYTGQTWRHDRYYDGTMVYYRSPERGNDLNNPSPHFLASLPTEPAELQSYLRSHLSGSTSLDEAVFVWVGDTLRLGYAPPDLRAAAIRVLERTPHINVQSTRDAIGRSTMQVTFTDEQNRPGESQSLFFDPSTSELLQEQETFSGETSTTTYTDSGVVDSIPATVRSRAANPNQPVPPPPLGVGGQATATPSPSK